MKENLTIKRFPVYLPMATYLELKEIAEEKDIPLTKVIVSIINAYLRFRKERMK